MVDAPWRGSLTKKEIMLTLLRHPCLMNLLDRFHNGSVTIWDLREGYFEYLELVRMTECGEITWRSKT